VDKLNDIISQVARESNFVAVCDVAALFHDLCQRGQPIGDRHLSTDYLGGLFGLSGHSLGHTGQALIANCVIQSINRSLGASMPTLELHHIVASDPVADYRAAKGRNWTDFELASLAHVSTSAPNAANAKNSRSYHPDPQLDKKYNSLYRDSPCQPLKLPAGMEQVLPVAERVSCFGDAIYVSQCQGLSESQFGTCANQYFGGLVMFAANLNGDLHVKFAPISDRITRFSIEIQAELRSHDGQLSAPTIYKLPVTQGKVGAWSGPVCSGTLDLATGRASDVQTTFSFSNSALSILASLNPNLLGQPVRFPGEYGTATVRFVPRSDGKLDFLFHGTTFIPLRAGARFPLPFAGPEGDFASIQANDTQLHPFLYLSTVVSEDTTTIGKSWIPTETVCDFTADVSRTCFGDDFTLNHPDLGFAQGRSHLAGRMMIQFGSRFGDLVPFSARMLPPAGSLNLANLSPLQDVFPGRLTRGMVGHDAVLRFTAQQYRQSDLYLLDDPFDIAVGAVNVFTGEVIGDFLHRGFLGQALFFALVRVEPRTPQGSFEYRGPASFERGPNGQIRFRFNGTVFLPYPEGFLWPLSDLANGVPIGPDSRLDPFFQVDAIYEPKQRFAQKQGSAKTQLAPTGDRFSYRYRVSNDPDMKAEFEYENHSQEATFVMHSLTAVDFVGFRPDQGEYDIATFAGFGRWSRDNTTRPRLANVQVSTAPGRHYISILIDGGHVSNVDTQLPSERPPLTALGNGDER
jgi:hypothetical protein